MRFVFADNVDTTIAAAISSTDTTITLASSANFPLIPPGYYWAVTLNDEATKKLFETVYVTSISGSNLTVLRGQEGTAARAWGTTDHAFAGNTAGTMNSLAAQDQLAGYVQLNPAVAQSGSTRVTGSGTFGAGVEVGGPLSAATTGSFSGDLTALDLIASKPYAGTNIANLPLRFNGANGLIGVGPSSALAANGITAEMLAIANFSNGACVVIDHNATVSTTGDFRGGSAVLTYQVSAPAILLGGIGVLNSITSTTLNLTRTGASYAIEIPSTVVPFGGSFVSDGNGGNPTIALPNYGEWFVEVFFGINEVTNTNMTLTLALTGGTLTGGFLTNANGHIAFNAEMVILVYGKGHTTLNNQTLIFTLTVAGGTLDASNQPWTVRATRTA